MEIVLRATVIFFFLWVLTRVLGKSTLSQLTAFELILLIVIGDLIQGGVTQEDTSMTGAALASGTLALWVLIFSTAAWRFRRAETVIEGIPTVVVSDGRVIDEALRLERLPVSDLLLSARQQGIGDIEQVKVAVLEANGTVSFVKKEQDGDGTSGTRRRYPPGAGS